MHYNKIMARSCHIWVILLLVLLGLLFIMVFGRAIKSTLPGSERSGLFGKAAVGIASFPSLMKYVLEDASETKD